MSAASCLYCSTPMSPIVNVDGNPVTITLASPGELLNGFPTMQVIVFTMNICPQCGFVAMRCDPTQLRPLPTMKDKLIVVRGGKEE